MYVEMEVYLRVFARKLLGFLLFQIGNLSNFPIHPKLFTLFLYISRFDLKLHSWYFHTMGMRVVSSCVDPTYKKQQKRKNEHKKILLNILQEIFLLSHYKINICIYKALVGQTRFRYSASAHNGKIFLYSA